MSGRRTKPTAVKPAKLFFRTNSDVAIVCNTGGKSLEKLLDFPVAPDSAPARAPEDNGNEPGMRYNVFTQAFEPIEEISDEQFHRARLVRIKRATAAIGLDPIEQRSCDYSSGIVAYFLQ
jgi:hypothetical protein